MTGREVGCERGAKSFQDPDNKAHKGSGIEILSTADFLKSQGILPLTRAENGATVIIETDEIVMPAEAGGVLGDAAASSTKLANAMYYGRLAGGRIKDGVDMKNKNNPSTPKDSMVIEFTRIPGTTQDRRDTIFLRRSTGDE